MEMDPGAAELRAYTYTCKTRCFDRDVHSGLAFNVIRTGNIVGRWARNSIISYFVSNARLASEEVEAVRVAMSIAASNWAFSGLSLAFVEAPAEEDATLLVIYDRFLGPNTFARAFFPGDSRRVIDIGPRFLSSARYTSNVLTHELGHVLGLRHELWDFYLPREKNNVYHWPSDMRDCASIMNNHNACNLPLLVLSEQDRAIVRAFYSLPGVK